MAYGIFVPWTRDQTFPTLQWKRGVLTTGLPGKSQISLFTQYGASFPEALLGSEKL